MSGPASEPTLSEGSAPAGWSIRPALPEDAEDVAGAVAALLEELGGTPPSSAAMLATTLELIEDDAAATVLVADCAGVLVGVLAASWQAAIHAAGEYCLIQDLWVAPDWRSQAVGAGLIAALREQVREIPGARIEVGLPSERFAGLASTESFYERNGFQAIGLRMRLVMP